MTSEPSMTVTIDSRAGPAFAAVGATIGLLVALVVGPVVSWLLDRIDSAPAPLRLETKQASAVYDRCEIAEIFLDKDELVLVDDRSRELSRTTSEAAIAGRLAQAFAEFDYPWTGTKDPREAAFTAWTDRSAELDDSVHALLRTRRRALTDKRWGEAEAVREDLAARGVVVRDRGEKQQYRLLRS